MRRRLRELDFTFIVIVVMIFIELIKILIVPNPFDVVLLGGLIVVLILTLRC